MSRFVFRVPNSPEGRRALLEKAGVLRNRIRWAMFKHDARKLAFFTRAFVGGWWSAIGRHGFLDASIAMGAMLVDGTIRAEWRKARWE